MENTSLTEEYDMNNEEAYDSDDYISYMNSIQTTDTIINLYNKNLSYLPRICNFTNLRILHCEYNNIKSIPRLSDTLVELHCDMNELKKLPHLPATLKELSCAGNRIKRLPKLKDSLIFLRCGDNRLVALPPLNDNLEFIDCRNNKITSLPTLNSNLRELVCHNNKLTSLPQLNDKLLFLSCHNNKLTSLPPLNIELETIFCSTCKLTSLPPLNDNLRQLFCGSNELTYLPDIDKLERFDCSYNPINDIICSSQYNNDIDLIKSRVKTLNRFRHLFQSLKYKNKFRKLLWENVREKNIKDKYSPDNLEVLLMDVEDDDFDIVLDSW